jgi:transcriptional regulator with XRE-family HTH domain
VPPTRQLSEHQLEQRRALGERIRYLRHERGLSQERLAERAGLDRQSVGNYERSALADALGVAPWRLLYG